MVKSGKWKFPRKKSSARQGRGNFLISEAFSLKRESFPKWETMWKTHIIFGACGGLNVFTNIIMFNNYIIDKVNKNFGACDGLIVLAIVLHAYDIAGTRGLSWRDQICCGWDLNARKCVPYALGCTLCQKIIRAPLRMPYRVDSRCCCVGRFVDWKGEQNLSNCLQTLSQGFELTNYQNTLSTVKNGVTLFVFVSQTLISLRRWSVADFVPM